MAWSDYAKAANRGTKMNGGKGWRLVTAKARSSGNRRWFKAALLKTLTVGGERIAIFRVAKPS